MLHPFFMQTGAWDGRIRHYFLLKPTGFILLLVGAGEGE